MKNIKKYKKKHIQLQNNHIFQNLLKYYLKIYLLKDKKKD